MEWTKLRKGVILTIKDMARVRAPLGFDSTGSAEVDIIVFNFRGFFRGWSGWSIDHPRILDISIAKL